MTAAEVKLLAESEEEQRVLHWRWSELERSGYEPEQAFVLAGDSEVDLHLACELLGRGCAPETALRILL
jgi:hypothetical protein